ncbi:MAG: aspartate/glutamate racemase family protein [Candidatus Sulfotelmatobacter sp.]
MIGGLGVGATVHYYQALAKGHEQRRLPLHLLMVQADVHRVVGCVQAKQFGDLAEYFAALIGQLKAGGADFAVIPAVTPHICIGELAAISALPLIDILKVVHEAKIGKRIALFGSRFTIETDLFGALGGENTIQPQASEVDQIHEAYMRTALRGEGAEEDREALTCLARRLMERDGVEAIVFAGTDLALLFNEANTPFPFIDCAQLHIEAIMKRLLR